MASDLISHDYVVKLLETGASGGRYPPAHLTCASLHLADGLPCLPAESQLSNPPLGEAPPKPPGPLLCVSTPWKVPLIRDWHWSLHGAGTCLCAAHRSSQMPRDTPVSWLLLGHPGAPGPHETMCGCGPRGLWDL